MYRVGIHIFVLGLIVLLIGFDGAVAKSKGKSDSGDVAKNLTEKQSKIHASISTDEIRFETSDGKLMKSIPIKALTMSKDERQRTDFFTALSPDKSCALLIKRVQKNGLALYEAQYYCEGKLNWTKGAPAGQEIDVTGLEKGGAISTDGARVIICYKGTMDSSAGEKVEVYDRTGSVILSAGGKDFLGIDEFVISKDGKLLFVRGLPPNGGSAAIFYNLIDNDKTIFNLEYNKFRSLGVYEEGVSGFKILGDGKILLKIPSK